MVEYLEALDRWFMEPVKMNNFLLCVAVIGFLYLMLVKEGRRL